MLVRLHCPGDLNNTDPLLGPLADSGGPTLTHALLPGSPAIDAGDNTGAPATDQRGVARPQDGDGNGSEIVDIGAFEVATAGPGGSIAPVASGHAADLVVSASAFDGSLGWRGNPLVPPFDDVDNLFAGFNDAEDVVLEATQL